MTTERFLWLSPYFFSRAPKPSAPGLMRLSGLRAFYSKAAVPGKTTDVSLKGIHVACDNPLPVGSSCQLVLLFGSQEEAVRVELGGTVVRTDRHGMAVEIENVLPIDTVTHLQNVVRYNAADGEQIDQEL